jgi:tRNA A37 threonylcarbamoyladenosine synthetase subunit TsaC/SUA5/YrdC
VHRIAMTDRHPDDREHGAALATAVQCLRSGGLVAFPTETVYGIRAPWRASSLPRAGRPITR